MFLPNVVWGLGFCIDCTGPEIDGEHEFTVKHSSWHRPRRKIHMVINSELIKLESWDRFRHFVKHCLFGHQNPSSDTSTVVCCLSHSSSIHSLHIYWLPSMCQSLFGHRAQCPAFMVLVFQEDSDKQGELLWQEYPLCPSSLIIFPCSSKASPLGTWLWLHTRCI